MAKRSAGLLLYRKRGEGIEVLLVHPGGPFWADRDAGSWSVPKGEVEIGEEALAVARREFEEETGHSPPAGEPIDLGEIRQASGKVVHAWAVEGDLDPARVTSNTFMMEWPPRSGRQQEFPEVDRAQWFEPDDARRRMNSAQAELVDRLLARLPEARVAP
ncbi:MAG: NUDIX domain-containing protein [Chloroflexi bacterium]|nr:MAG: NUDIX domain-containing protein [Chloroflexota bacterium]